MSRARFALSVIALCLSASLAQATTLEFDANLDGLQETPPNASPGTGFGSLFLDDTNGNWSITNGVFQDLTAPATAAHIHGPAPAGTPAGIIAGLTVTPATAGTFSGAGTFTAAQMTDLINGLYYINIHSSNFPGGEIRGQLLQVPEPTSAVLVSLGVGVLAGLRRRSKGQRALA